MVRTNVAATGQSKPSKASLDGTGSFDYGYEGHRGRLDARIPNQEAEISTARGTDFSDANTSIVSVGTIVNFKDLNSGNEETVTVLGAWDTDTEKGIVSYLSGMGAAMLGKSEGEEIELPTEKEGEMRTVLIKEIKAYFTPVS